MIVHQITLEIKDCQVLPFAYWEIGDKEDKEDKGERRETKKLLPSDKGDGLRRIAMLKSILKQLPSNPSYPLILSPLTPHPS
jgi:hypothetical protein